jgi:hypothetical protein
LVKFYGLQDDNAKIFLSPVKSKPSLFEETTLLSKEIQIVSQRNLFQKQSIINTTAKQEKTVQKCLLFDT